MAYLLGGLERDRDSGRIGIQAASSAFGAAVVSAVAMSCQPSSFRNTICPRGHEPEEEGQDRVLTRQAALGLHAAPKLQVRPFEPVGAAEALSTGSADSDTW